MKIMSSGINGMIMVDGENVSAVTYCRQQAGEKERLALALKEYDTFNHIRNDLEAYLAHLALWAFDNYPELLRRHGSLERPTRKDYGLDN